MYGVTACAMTALSCDDAIVIVGRYDAGQMVSGAAGEMDSPIPDWVDTGSTLAGDAAVGATDSGASTPNAPKVTEHVAITPGTLAEYCSGHGPSVLVGPDTNACTATLGRRLFTHGLCSCTDLQLRGESFVIDAFDSTRGATLDAQTGAAIGVNGSVLALARTTRVFGSMTVAGSDFAPLDGKEFLVGGDAKIASAIKASAGDCQFARDLWLGGPLSASVPVRVARDVYHNTSAPLPSQLRAAGDVQARSFVTAPPCACGAGQTLDIAQLVELSQMQNDNQLTGLSRDAFAGVIAGVPLELACGRYALSSVSILGNLLVRVTGRTALFVAGDFAISGNLNIELAQGAELDVFVAGNLSFLVGLASFGVAERPSALRFYVAGAQTISTLGLTTFAAELYAPNATIELAGVDTYGSFFGKNIVVADGQHVHFDRAIVSAGEDCAGPLPERCDACDQCPRGLACSAGECADCQRDADCCEPLACTQGRCQPLLLEDPTKP